MFVIFMLLCLCACVNSAKDSGYDSVDYTDKEDFKEKQEFGAKEEFKDRKRKEPKSSKEEDTKEFSDKEAARAKDKPEDDYDDAQYEGYGRRLIKQSGEKEANVDLEETENERNDLMNNLRKSDKLKNDMVNAVRGVLGVAHVDDNDDNDDINKTTTEEPGLFKNRRYDDSEMDKSIEKGTRRIFNADETADIVEYPYLAAVLVSGELWCSGVVIDTDKILTTAHCLQVQYNNRFFKEFVKMISVRVGSNNATAGGEIWTASEIYFHPHYRPSTLLYNIAVIILSNNMTYDDNVKNIEYSRDMTQLTKANITFLGWGTVDDGQVRGGQVLLQKITLPIYNHNDCRDVYGTELVTTNNFCAGYISLMKNVCNHDAGGPAILDGKLIGLLSFTYSRCDVMDKPAVFVYVPRLTYWLDNIYDRSMKDLNVAGE